MQQTPDIHALAYQQQHRAELFSLHSRSIRSRFDMIRCTKFLEYGEYDLSNLDTTFGFPVSPYLSDASRLQMFQQMQMQNVGYQMRLCGTNGASSDILVVTVIVTFIVYNLVECLERREKQTGNLFC